MGRLAPAKAAVTTTIRKIFRFHACDRCGMSHDNAPISHARFEVVTAKGSIYLCGHHYREHSEAILKSDHEVVAIEVPG